MEKKWMRRTKKGVSLQLKIVPKALKTEVIGEYGDLLKVAVKGAPVDNEANEELIRFLSKKLKVNKKNFKIISGKTSRTKLIEIEGYFNISWLCREYID